jgi:hypothetical protein
MLSVSSYLACLMARRQMETIFLMFLAAAPPPLPAYVNEDIICLEVQQP